MMIFQLFVWTQNDFCYKTNKQIKIFLIQYIESIFAFDSDSEGAAGDSSNLS